MSTVSKGNYYRKKTIDWYSKHGYQVEIIEKNQRIFNKHIDKVINVKKDIFGSDLIAMNEEEIIFIQCKSRAQDVNSGIKQMEQYKFPPFVQRHIVYWEVRAKEPTVVEVDLLYEEASEGSL